MTNPIHSINLFLVGKWKKLYDLLYLLHQHQLRVSLVPDIASLKLDNQRPSLLLIAMEDDKAICHIKQAIHSNNIPWIAWADAQKESLAKVAYSTGAWAIFPTTVSAEILASAVKNIVTFLERPFHPPAHSPNNKRTYTYSRDTVISPDSGMVLKINEGIVEVSTIHDDGHKVLLGLYGKGHTLIGHSQDSCFIQFIAYTDTQVTIQEWEEAIKDINLVKQLRTRIAQTEAWMAMQARPHLAQRVFGILSLLGEQFGIPYQNGLLIDIRITHASLASAVGCTRTSMTRTLGNLRKLNKLSVISTEKGERFCLYQWEKNLHALN